LGTSRTFDPASVEDRYLTERVVDVAFDDGARVVNERGDIIVGILHHVQAFVQRTVARLVGLSRKSVYKALEPTRDVA
jgi:DNA-binding phage protein